jgi:hypothetical protein
MLNLPKKNKFFKKETPKVFFGTFCFLFFIAFPLALNAIDVNIGNHVVVSAIVSEGSGGGGGGGGGGGLPTIVNFSGMAYPSEKVTILKDGNIAVTTIADPTARFSVSLTNLTGGTYTFSVYGTDVHGTKSLTFSFPIFITEGTTVNVSGIFLSPTINIDKSEVKRGESLLVFGQTIPGANLNVVFNSNEEIIRQTKTDITGLYSYSMDTSPLEYGNHGVKSKTILDQTISATSIELPFLVSLVSKLKDEGECQTNLRGDLNCDGRVNLVDFSIMAYWYKRPSPPKKIDLSGDGQVTLSDFSIMVYYWTG